MAAKNIIGHLGNRKTKALRWTLKILILIITALSIYIFFDVQYRKNLRTFQAAHEIANASDVVNGKAAFQFNKNKELIKSLEAIFKKRKDNNLKFHEKQDSAQFQNLIQKANKLHHASSLLFRNLLEDTTSYFFYGLELTSLVEKENTRQPANKYTLEAEITTSEQHSSRIQAQLSSFLKLTAPYAKSPATQRQYNTLKNLAALTPEIFYKEVYSNNKAYLVLAETGIIKSCIASIEANCLERINAKITLLTENNEPIKPVWFAYTPNAPAIVKPGDTLKLVSKLYCCAYLINPKLVKQEFSFRDGKIDSIQNNSFAYARFTADNNKKKKFTLRLKTADNLLDTTFSGEFEYPLRTVKQANK